MAYNVLLIDDQREVTRMLRASLETLDAEFAIREVPSAEEAMLERVKELDLLVSDVMLPGMSGLDLVKRFRRQKPDLKVILMTGTTDRKLRQQVIDAKTNAYFLKPIEVSDFLDAVERVLGIVEAVDADAPDHAKSSKMIENESEHLTDDKNGQAPSPSTSVVKEDPTPEPETAPSAADPPEEEMSATVDRGVSEQLAIIRSDLNAIAVVMLNDRGQLLVQAGELPEEGIERNLIPSLMSVFSSSQKIAHYLKMLTPENLLCFTGASFDVVFSHVGRSYGLLVFMKNALERETFPLLAKAVGSGVRVLLEILANMGVSLHVDEDDESQVSPFVMSLDDYVVEEETVQMEAAFQDLFAQPDVQEKMIEEDVDSFWDDALNDETLGGHSRSDALSYEQALQLGLVPTDEDEDEASG